ncbi:hypothetical protein SGODD07_01748 [Streptococcus gordonii]|uniref:Uncharacterized protein n=1 Tax=Streptococcus gordonii TaxID=1302 RepID=A0A139N109_STRGN|nr:hypothetical protein SGODD07_01748 [Streptococcus gordonii]
MIGRFLRLLDQDAVNFSEIACFIQQGANLVGVTAPVFITDIASIEEEELVIKLHGRARVSAVAVQHRIWQHPQAGLCEVDQVIAFQLYPALETVGSSEREVLIEQDPLAVKKGEAVGVVEQTCLGLYMVAGPPRGLGDVFLDVLHLFCRPVFIASIALFSCPSQSFALRIILFLITIVNVFS